MLILLLVIISLPTLIYFSFYIPSVQRYAVKNVSQQLSKYFNTKITFSEISFFPIYRIAFKDFCIYSQKNDTLLYSKKLVSGINFFTISGSALDIRTVTLESPKINFYIDSTKNINFQFIIDKFSTGSKNNSSSSFDFGINHIRIENGSFNFKTLDTASVEYGMNYKDIYLRNFNLEASNFKSRGSTISLRLKHMSALERSGFELIDFSARAIIDSSNLAFNGVEIKTKLTEIEANQIRLNFKSYKHLGSDFINNVTLFADIDKASSTTDDIAFFAPRLKDFHFPAKLSGKVTGKVKSLRGRNLNVEFGESSYFTGNIDIDGLPDIQSSFLFLDIKKLYVTPSDLENINIPNAPAGHLQLPGVLHKLQYFAYSGKFSGFINDFVAYGTISSNLGKISSDLSIRPDSSNRFSFKGKLKTTDFDLGYLLDKKDIIGKISLNAMVNGSNSASNGLTATMNGEISSFQLKKYTYKNIAVNGTLSGKTFDGSMSISDPNIDLSFLGKVNFSTEIPEFNFSAKVERANLYKLNIDTIDSASFVSFYATANFTGKNIDNIDGEIKLWNSTLKRTGKEIHVDDLLLYTENIPNAKKIILRSDLADADIWGTYQFKHLAQTFQWFAKHYVPSLIVENIPPEQSTLNNFNFDINFKDTRLVTDFFVPGLYISRDSKLTGTYNPSASNVNFKLKVPFMNFRGKKVYDININTESNSQSITVETGCSSFKLNNNLSLDNFTVLAEARNDSLFVTNRWNNWDTIAYKGNIVSVVTFSPSQNQKYPQVNVDLTHSYVVMQDSVWKISPSHISIDNRRIAVNSLDVFYNNQKINVKGAISRIPDDKLLVSCAQLNLSVINSFFKGSSLDIEGVVNGQAEISNLYKNPYFRSDLHVDSLRINNETLGNTDVIATWNNADKSISLEMTALRGNLKTLELKGIYQTLSKQIDGKINLNKLKVNLVQPFAKFLVSDLRGLATGELEVNGTITEPLFNGEINLQRASFMINYLKTRYSFSKPIKIKDSNILVDNLVLYDSNGNKCEVNGKVTHTYFKKFNFDLVLRADNFEFLNTTEKDNNLFYGKVYATTRKVEIFGPPNNLTMNINARTEKNTVLAIPLGNRTAELGDSKFIKFIDKTPKIVTPDYDYDNEVNKKKNYTVNLNGLNLNIDLEVTPEASAQIIFDQKIGDMIQGNGSGNIRMEINTQGKFSMFGNFTITQGDYLFTLQNVINKHFKVMQGGTVSWKGNPTDATIDLKAIYPVRASLSDLLPTAPEEYKNRIPIECKIALSGKLMNPDPKFEINLPNSTPEAQAWVNSAISNQDELNKQFISLLVLGSFLPDQSKSGSSTASSGTESSSGMNPVGSTGMEFVSNQLSNWLSQINKDFDIGVNYRPGTELTSQELEVALSTQLLNDKVSINGNLDMGGTSNTPNNQNANNIVGDFEVDYKPWKSGKVRFKAFNRSNESYITELSPYTQGVGITYKEDFNYFGELLKRYWNGIFGKKEDEIKPEAGLNNKEE